MLEQLAQVITQIHALRAAAFIEADSEGDVPAVLQQVCWITPNHFEELG